MDELDMSRPGGELFPEASQQNYNSYTDVNQGHVVDDPLNTGVKSPYDDAGQGQLSQKEMNFGALRDEVAKFKQESEYWRGQAEAYSKVPTRHAEPDLATKDPYSGIDWDNSGDVQKAFEAIRHENQSLRQEMKDSMAAIATKSQHQDWNHMVTQHVPQLTSKNPIFAEMIQKASNPYEAAYLLAELNSRASTTGADHRPPEYGNRNGNAQRAIANAQKPQTLASVGGNGTLSNADYYASMSDEDFMKVAARNMASI